MGSDEVAPPLVWVCDRCGYKTADRFAVTVSRGRSSHCCDSCGGELVCSGCYDHPEFCDCSPPLRTSAMEEPEETDNDRA